MNLFGTANACKAVIPYMKKCGRGRIINISSVAAVMPIPFQVWYSVSKSGINAYTCGLANEVRQFGITVCTIMFGDINTGFKDAKKKSERGNSEYGGCISRSVSRMEADENSGYTADEAASYVMHIVKKKCPSPLNTMGVGYKAAVFADRLLSVRIKNYILYKFYGGQPT